MDKTSAGRRCAADIATLLAARPDARLLDAGADTLALLLPQFEGVAAATIGRAACAFQFGAYARPRLAGGRFASPPGRIALRLAPGRGERIVHVPGDGAETLRLVDAGGRLAHRARIAAPADRARLMAFLKEIPERARPVALSVPPVAVASLPAIRRAREEWAEAETAAHADDWLLDGGRTRRTCLPHLKSEARRIDPRAIGPFVAHLARTRRPFRCVVARPGCLQLQDGPLDGFRHQGGRLFLRARRGVVMLDLAGIAGAWVTRIGRGRERAHALEFYDADGCAAAAFLPPGEPDPCRNTVWEILLASLPRAPAAATPATGRRVARAPEGDLRLVARCED